MAEMAIGYGSEYQLLRYLGHHRNYFYKEIMKMTGSNNQIEWLDYPVQLDRLSRDGELKGIVCFQNLGADKYKEIEDAWKQFWPQSGNSHNWDGIFMQDNVWYFVEAKANLAETNQRCGAGKKSREIIVNAFQKVTGDRTIAGAWIESDCYQLANRLAFIEFCRLVGIKAKLVYISFINGYDVNPRESVIEKGQWDECWQKEYAELKIEGRLEYLKDSILHLYIDCHKPK